MAKHFLSEEKGMLERFEVALKSTFFSLVFLLLRDHKPSIYLQILATLIQYIQLHYYIFNNLVNDVNHFFMMIVLGGLNDNDTTQFLFRLFLNHSSLQHGQYYCLRCMLLYHFLYRISVNSRLNCCSSNRITLHCLPLPEDQHSLNDTDNSAKNCYLFLDFHPLSTGHRIPNQYLEL